MADFSALKTSIQNYIKQNGNEEITGNLLQQILLSMVSTLGDSAINDLVTALNAEIANRGNVDTELGNRITSEAEARAGADNTLRGLIDGITANIGNGYVYAGIATPSSTPVSGKVFYLALTAGTYTNFGATVVPQGINILKYNGSAWSLDSFLGLDDAPTQGSSNLVKSGGVLDSIIKDGSAFDLSAYNNGATYADLSAALTALNALPAAYKKGGMSMKFVQSSDNKYVQYRLMSDEWSIDTNDWAIAEEGVYVENPEFIRVVTDKDGRILACIKTDGSIDWAVGVPKPVKVCLDTKADKEENKSLIDENFANGISYIENPEFICVSLDSENKVLFGVQKDGNFLFGAGVPKQVIDYIERKIADLSLDEYEDIVAFLNGLEEGDKTLQTLLNEKVDKEEGKSLIPTQYIQEVENSEFISVDVDAEDKILEATEKDGTKLFGANVKVLGSIDISGVNYKVVNNPEWLKAVVDAEDRVICGIKTDGRFVVYIADFLDDIEAIKARLEELDAYSVIENPEFMEVELDANDKILSGRKVDGTKFENNDVELNDNATIYGSLEVDGVIETTVDDPEGRMDINTDSEKKIISYRDKDGRLCEKVGIETNSLHLTEDGMTEFLLALKAAGFTPGRGGDWSEKEVVEIPEPKSYAILNLNINGLPAGLINSKEGYAEYYDKEGNYFKKAVIVETQGQSSKHFSDTGGRGNYTLDIDDGSEIKFGSWVPQDSFHLKGTPKDVTHGILATSYKWAYMFMEYLDAKPNRVLLKDSSNITTTNASGDRFTDWIDDARCLPDGFPVEIYVDGEYWGLYALQLKKHRKNYSIKKSDYTSLFIDADNLLDSDYQHGFWLDGVDSAPAGTTGKTWWNYFDIKGPKDLVCMDGSAFDGDHPKELIDSTSPVYNDDNKKHKGSAQAKAIIRGFSTKYLEVKELIDNNNIEGAKAKFNENFDYNACMLVYIFNCLMNNGDSIKKNTLWGTWKDGKIAPMLWDIDGVYGTDWWGGTCGAPSTSMWAGGYATSAWPLSFMWTLYQDEIKATYAELRSHGIIDMNTWKSIVFGWAKQIGTEAFDRDIEKWPEMPSYRENYTNTDYWEEYGSSSAYSTYPTWDENTSYSIGDIVVIRIHPQVNWFVRYKAVQASDANNPQCPVTQFYEAMPQVGGYYDSPKRMEKWMEEQIRLCDIVMEYNQ